MENKKIVWKETSEAQREYLAKTLGTPFKYRTSITARQYHQLRRTAQIDRKLFCLSEGFWDAIKQTVYTVYTNNTELVGKVLKGESLMLKWTMNTTEAHKDQQYMAELTLDQAYKVGDFMEKYPDGLPPFKASTTFKSGDDNPHRFRVYVDSDHVKRLVEAIIDGKPAALIHNGSPAIDPLTPEQLNEQIDKFVTAYRNMYAQAVAHTVDKAYYDDNTAILALVPDSHFIAKAVLLITAQTFAPEFPTEPGYDVLKMLTSVLR